MEEYRTETTVTEDGHLSLEDLPFRKGDHVEVVITGRARASAIAEHPLRGTRVTYKGPFESVAEEDWDALRGSS